MKILIDLTSIYDKLSGIEKFCLNISKNMLLEDKKNEYILLFKKEVHKEFEFIYGRTNIKYETINIDSKIILGQVVLPLYLYKHKCDFYLFLAFPSPILFFNKNSVSAVHDMTPWLYPETMSKKGLIYFRLLIKHAVKYNKLILTVSNNSKKDIVKHFNCNNIEVVYNGVDNSYREYYQNDFEIAKEKYKLPEKYMLCLGTLEPRKNINLLIDAFIKLKKDSNIHHKLVITGRYGWKYEAMLDRIKESGINEGEIIFTGFVDEEHLPYIYKGAELFIFPSLYEGFGIPPLEAMAAGTPIITSNSSSLPEVVGEKGITFENNNLEDLVSKVNKLLNSSNIDKENYIEYCLERSRIFDWKREGKKLINILDKNYNR